MANFTFTPLYTFQRTVGRRVRISEFESGKEQRADLGPMPREWSLSFGGTQAYIKQIVDFYTAQLGPVTAFTWTPPGTSSPVNVRFKDGETTITINGSSSAFIDLVLREVL